MGPQYVRKDVLEATLVLRDLVTDIAGPSNGGDIEEQHTTQTVSKFFLNAPAHLFVSVKIAKAMPQLLESVIVSSYRHHLPGKISNTWPHSAVDNNAEGDNSGKNTS